MQKWVFLNNAFVEEEKAFLHFKDLSFQRGYGVFDFFRLHGNKPLFLDEHLKRFFASAAGLHLPVPLSETAIKTTLQHLMDRNQQPGAGIRISLTGGYSEDGFSIGQPNFLLSQHPITPPTRQQVQNGIRLLLHPYQRPLPQVKSIDYLMAIYLQPNRIAQSADDILYHAGGFISECPRSNFFLVTGGGKLVTPAENALAGITRKKVLQIARHQFTVEERPVALFELATAKEAFITSTTRQILPVTRIDDYCFSQTRVSQQLLQQFQASWLNGPAV